MPLLFVREDITRMRVDAIVNAANQTLLGGGGVDGAIHHAAGPRLLEECRTLGGCSTGEAKRTNAYDLPCRYVIHTVGPVWQDGQHGERLLLQSCYEKSLALAAASLCESVAFPLISAGVYGYPKAEAVEVAVETIRAFLETHEMTVYLVLFDRDSVDVTQSRFGAIRQWVDDRFTEEQLHLEGRRRQGIHFSMPLEAPQMMRDDMAFNASAPKSKKKTRQHFQKNEASEAEVLCNAMPDAELPDLDTLLKQVDESFSQMVLRLIDEKGITDTACYKKANMDRKLFSKIRSDIHYKPKKTTAISLAIALELSFGETQELLQKAGYTLTRSSRFDIIIEYFIRSKNYDIFEINEALFSFDQVLLGA